jgi:hypothetical protein
MAVPCGEEFQRITAAPLLCPRAKTRTVSPAGWGVPQAILESTRRTSCCRTMPAPRPSNCCSRTNIGQMTACSPCGPWMSIRPSFRSVCTFQPAGALTEKPTGSLCFTHCAVAGAETVFSGAPAAAVTLAGEGGAGWTSGFFTGAGVVAGSRISASPGAVCGALTSIIARITRSLTEADLSSMS